MFLTTLSHDESLKLLKQTTVTLSNKPNVEQSTDNGNEGMCRDIREVGVPWISLLNE